MMSSRHASLRRRGRQGLSCCPQRFKGGSLSQASSLQPPPRISSENGMLLRPRRLLTGQRRPKPLKPQRKLWWIGTDCKPTARGLPAKSRSQQSTSYLLLVRSCSSILALHFSLCISRSAFLAGQFSLLDSRCSILAGKLVSVARFPLTLYST